jgi:hypothetical protein
MVLVQELINDSGISAIGAAFFTALFAAVSAIGVAIVSNKRSTDKLKNETVKAAESAAEAAANTTNVSNGFVNRMDRKLDLLATNQDRLEVAFQEHLAWHTHKETQKGNVE